MSWPPQNDLTSCDLRCQTTIYQKPSTKQNCFSYPTHDVMGGLWVASWPGGCSLSLEMKAARASCDRFARSPTCALYKWGLKMLKGGGIPKSVKNGWVLHRFTKPYTHLIHPYTSYILLYSSGLKMPCFIPIHHIAAWNRCLTWNLEGGLSLLARGTVTWKAPLQIRGTLSKSNVAMGNHPRMVNCPLSCWITRVYLAKKKNTMDCQCPGEVDERCAALPSVPNHLMPPSHQSSGCSSRDPTELPQCQGHSVDPNGWVQGFIRFDNFWNSIFRKSIASFICW